MLVVAGLAGLAVGSFVNCWAWRSTHGESVLRGRSHCTSCGHELGVRDLVPVLSWLAAPGRCRYCGQKVPGRYPATELVCAAVYVGILVVWGPTLQALEIIAFASVLLFLSLTDIDDYFIPDGCIIAAACVRLAYLLAAWQLEGADLAGLLAFSLVGALALGVGMLALVLVMDRVLGRESMGWGDVKLLAVAGFYFGWQQGLFLLIVACVIGLAVAAVTASAGSPDAPAPGADADDDAADALAAGADAGTNGPEAEHPASRPIPFGPSIALACVITMLVGDPFVSWYLSLIL